MKLRAGALAAVILGSVAVTTQVGAAALPPLPIGAVYTCTVTDTIAPTGATTLTTVGTSVCDGLLSQQATTSIALQSPVPLLSLSVPLSSSSSSCSACASLTGSDSATVVPVHGLSYQGSFVDTITAPSGSSFTPSPGCFTAYPPNVLYCVATSTYTY